MIDDVNAVAKKPHQGLWGKIGGAIGMGLGAIAAPVTGGFSIPAGMAAGSAIGSTVGGLANPGKPGVGAQSVPLPINNASQDDPAFQHAYLTSALQSLPQAGLPAPKQQAIADHISTARDTLGKGLGL